MEMLPHEKEIMEHVHAIDQLRKKNESSSLFSTELEHLEKKLQLLKKKVYNNLNPWQRVQISRHPQRPHTQDYISQICDSFQELSGDRQFSDDPAIIGGLAQIGEMKCVLIGQEKGKTTEERLKRNFGMPHPEGYRKAKRLMQLAERFNLPIVTLIDTPGANPNLESEERGQGWAIAENIREMSQFRTPIIVVIIGEGCSGGALGMGVGDVVAMFEHSYYTVISPEGCASILWNDSSKKEDAAEILKLNSEWLLEKEIIDAIIPEPLGGAHHNPKETTQSLKNFLLTQWEWLKRIPPETLIEERYEKFRKIGHYLSS